MRTITAHKKETAPLNYLTDEEKKFQNHVKHFAQTEVSPLIHQMDNDAKMDKGLINSLFTEGLMNIEIPEAYGGSAHPFFYSILAIEEMAIVDPAVAVFIDVHNTLVVNALIRWGTESQKERFLPRLANGTVGAFSITEEEAGSDAASLTCRAEKVDNGYILNGKKHWVTNAAEAELFIMFAKVPSSNPAQSSSSGHLTAFIIDKKVSEGITVCEPQLKMGIRASSTCDMIMDNVFVPDENVLGSRSKGLMILLETLSDGRIGISAQMLGLAQGAFDEAVKYSGERIQFGEYISTYQGVHFPLAQLATEIQAVRLMIYNAVRMKQAKCNFRELVLHSSMVKLYASQVAERAASQCLEIIGGKGYMKGNVLEKLYRDAKIGTIYEGTSNIQLSNIARHYVKIK